MKTFPSKEKKAAQAEQDSPSGSVGEFILEEWLPEGVDKFKNHQSGPWIFSSRKAFILF
jgi:hypothetical protein